MEKFKAVFVFGECAVSKYESNPDINVAELTDYGEVKVIFFDTEAELKAYTKGLNDAIGWKDVTRAYNLEK